MLWKVVFSVRGHAGGRVGLSWAGAAVVLLCASEVAGECLVWAGGGPQMRYRLPWAALQGHRLGQ